jgi:hypothetical protein
MNFEIWWDEVGFAWVKTYFDLNLEDAKELSHKV